MNVINAFADRNALSKLVMNIKFSLAFVPQCPPFKFSDGFMCGEIDAFKSVIIPV